MKAQRKKERFGEEGPKVGKKDQDEYNWGPVETSWPATAFPTSQHGWV